MKQMILSALLMAMSLAVKPQFSLSGQVTDRETNEPLIGAHISLEYTLLRTLTDHRGFFRIDNLRSGTYLIRISFVGYEPYKENFTVDGSKTLQITMQRKEFLSDEVVISATRAGENTPTAHSTLSSKEIQDMNSGRDVPFLLETLPSVIATSDAGTGVGYTSIRIRGTDMNRINITVNGIPLNDSESHGVWWVNMPDFASSIDNIQVQRGVGTSTNGAAAFGASINLQTHQLRQEPYAGLTANYGSYSTLKNTISFGSGLINKNFTFDGRLSKISSDGYIDRAWSDLRSYYLTGSYHAAKTIFRASVFSGTEKTYQAWDGVPSYLLATHRSYNGIGEYSLPNGQKVNYENETDNYKQDHYQFFFSYEPRRQLNLHLALHYTRGFGYYEQYKANRKFADYGLPNIKLPGNYLVQGSDTLYFPGGQIKRTDLIRRKYLDNHFYGMVWSTNYQRKQIQLTFGGSLNQYIGEHYGTVIWMKFAGNTTNNYRWYENTGNKTDANLYAKVMWHLNKEWRLFGDLQFRSIHYNIDGIDDDLRNISQQHEFSFLNPKMGLMWEPILRHKVFMSYASARREPSRSNFTDANPANLYQRRKLFMTWRLDINITRLFLLPQPICIICITQTNWY